MPSERAESADWPCQARLRGLHGDIDDELGNDLVGPVSMPEGVDGGTVGQSDSGSSEDAGSVRTRMLSHALNIRCLDAAASESMDCLADIGGLLTSAALAKEVRLVRAGDRRELSNIDRRATAAAPVTGVGGGGAVAGAALNKAADDAVSSAAASRLRWT